MSEIKVGDLVMVVRPTRCCGDNTTLGQIDRVTKLHSINSRCPACLQEVGVMDCALGTDGHPIGRPTYRLKPIPPLADIESSTTEALDPADCLAAYETQPKEMI